MAFGKAAVRTHRYIISLFLLSTIAACAPSDTGGPEAPSTPHYVNDLSTLSAKPVAEMSNPQAAYEATNETDSFGHAFQDQPGSTRHVGTDATPAVQQLMNLKAAQFAGFSGSLLDRLWGQVRLRETDDDIARLKLPDTLQPVILTATLAPDGKLLEIVIDQRSGKAIVDKMFIEACKKSIWTSNPPKAAALPNGTYQVRIEGRIENFASQANRWTFKTYMGIAVL
jgi:hypothetical protein